MTIGATRRNDASGNDSTATYPYGFKIFAATQLEVKVRKTSDGSITTLSYPTQYSVTNVGNKNGGNVVLSDVDGAWQDATTGYLKTGYDISIRRVVALTQVTDIRNQGGFFPDVHEDKFDYLTMLDQQQQDDVDRAIKLDSAYDPDDFDLTLPAPVAGQAIGFNATADGLSLITSLGSAATTAFTLSLLDDASADAFLDTIRAALAAEVTPAVGDRLLLDDVSAGAWDYITVADLMKILGGMTALTAPASGDSLGIYDLSATDSRSITLEDLFGLYAMAEPGGRITLATGDPVPSSNQTGKTTVYYTPYKHNIVWLYDGAKFVPKVFTELSQTTADNTKSPAAVANNSNYDLFVWNDAGTLRCTRGPAWTSDTVRGTGAGTTELERVQGRWVNKVDITNGPAAQRGLFVGSVRSDGSAQINDSSGGNATAALRHVSNAYNVARRGMGSYETADNWTYTTNAYRPMNNNTAIRLDYLSCLGEHGVDARASFAYQNGGGSAVATASIGVNATDTAHADATRPVFNSVDANEQVDAFSMLATNPGLGQYDLYPLENGLGAANGVWLGDNGGNYNHGIQGWVMA